LGEYTSLPIQKIRKLERSEYIRFTTGIRANQYSELVNVESGTFKAFPVFEVDFFEHKVKFYI